MADWDPELYNRFRRYRAEPVAHILGRLVVEEDERIVDLGCGSGENTVELLRRTVRGTARGIDGSPAMIEAANRLRATLPPAMQRRLSFERRDVAEFGADREYTIVFSNAALHWLRDRRGVFGAILRALAPGGRVIAQMPANALETGKVQMEALVAEAPWRAMLAHVSLPFREDPQPEHYRQMLAEIGLESVDCYHLTFHHPMERAADVAQWYRSTGLRPYLDALPADRQEEFIAAYSRRLEAAYGTAGPITFDFRRLFIWGRRPAN